MGMFLIVAELERVHATEGTTVTPKYHNVYDDDEVSAKLRLANHYKMKNIPGVVEYNITVIDTTETLVKPFEQK